MAFQRFAPGPRGTPVFGCFAAFRDDPLGLLMACRAEHGPVVQLPVGLGMSFCLAFDPPDLEQVFQGQQFGRSDLAALFEPLAGGSMIIADGARWKQQRKAVAPAFGQDKIRQLAGLIDADAESAAQRWLAAARAGVAIDLQGELVAYAMSNIALFLLGRRLTAQEIEVIAPAWTRSLLCMNRRLSQSVPVPMWLPTPTNLALKRSAGAIAGVLSAVVRQRRSGGATAFLVGGFLGDLLAYRDDDGAALSDEQIVREIMGVFLASFDTIASAMMWTFDFLSRDQEWQDRVRADVAALAPPAQARSDLADCPILERVFNESIRLMPPLWLVDRKNAEPVVLGGYTIPAATNIITSPYVTHRDPRLWPQPLRFDPDRFLPEAAAGRAKFAYFPFGGGRMKCIGILLAQLEMKAIARHVLRHVRLVGGAPPQLESSFVLRTRAGLPVCVQPLAGRPAAAPARALADCP